MSAPISPASAPPASRPPAPDESGAEKISNAAKGAKAGTSGFSIKLGKSTQSCKIDVKTNYFGKNQSVFRFDKGHTKGATAPHVNINSKVSGVKDPHISIGETGLTVGENAAKICQGINKILVPLAVAFDTYREAKAIYADVQHGTTRNSVETAASIAGGWSGGFGGATTGAYLGTMIFPGIGTLVGGIIGGLSGGIGGSFGAEKLAEKVSDKFEYDIVVADNPCRKCGEAYSYRKYLVKDDGFCGSCKECIDCDITDSNNDVKSDNDDDNDANNDVKSDNDDDNYDNNDVKSDNADDNDANNDVKSGTRDDKSNPNNNNNKVD